MNSYARCNHQDSHNNARKTALPRYFGYHKRAHLLESLDQNTALDNVYAVWPFGWTSNLWANHP